MPADSILAKFPQSEFFSVLPSGFYAFSALYVTAVLPKQPEQSLWVALGGLAAQVKENPVLLLFLLLASYFLGSVFRAVPVRWISRVVPPFRDAFPHGTEINRIIATLRANEREALVLRGRLPSTDGAVPIEVFNYWKDALCVNSPDAFVYYQTFETRVRLFASTLCAAAVGVVCSLVLMFTLHSASHAAAGWMLLISLALLSVFALNFRSVRRQESHTLAMLYIAARQKHPLEA